MIEKIIGKFLCEMCMNTCRLGWCDAYSSTRRTNSIQFTSIQKFYCPFKSNIKNGKMSLAHVVLSIKKTINATLNDQFHKMTINIHCILHYRGHTQTHRHAHTDTHTHTHRVFSIQSSNDPLCSTTASFRSKHPNTFPITLRWQRVKYQESVL